MVCSPADGRMNPALSLSDQSQAVLLSILRIRSSLKLNPVIPIFPETVPLTVPDVEGTPLSFTVTSRVPSLSIILRMPSDGLQ